MISRAQVEFLVSFVYLAGGRGGGLMLGTNHTTYNTSIKVSIRIDYFNIIAIKKIMIIRLRVIKRKNSDKLIGCYGYLIPLVLGN